MVQQKGVRLALIVAVLGLAAGLALARGRTAPEPVPAEILAPLVRVATVERAAVRLSVRAHGSVEPRTESELVMEVAGRVVAIAPALAAGGFFEEGEVLVEIDSRDYASALLRAEAALRRAHSERNLADAELARLTALSSRGVASASAFDSARHASQAAAASEDEATAGRDEARRNLARTQLRAPYAGRVREKWVDVGQFVGPGKPVIRLYAVDYAEVRLPIPDAELADLDLPLDSRDAQGARPELPVRLRASFSGQPREWHGRIVRVEGEIDPTSRMIHIVARVDDPYGAGVEAGGSPLPVGLFVDAEILGRTLEDVIRLPREALREDGQVYSVDADGRLRRHGVAVVRARGEEILVRGALNSGERVCVSDLAGAREGMQVRVREGDDS
jgi:RND family efflux transporter MFP subunit